MEKDILSKEYFSSDERYADLINGLGFQGRQIVKIEVRKIKDTKVFKTDIRQVFDLIRYSEEPQKLKELVEHDEAYQSMEEDAYDMVAANTDTKGLISMKKYHKKGKKVNMCGAIAALVAEGKMTVNKNRYHFAYF